MSAVKQQIKKKILSVVNEDRSCGRIICHCLMTLDLNDINDYEIYKKCYKTWINFNKVRKDD